MSQRISQTDETDDRFQFPDGRRVRSLRKNKGWSQQFLASAAKTGKSTIERIEKGKRVRLETLLDVAATLDVEYKDILASDGVSHLAALPAEAERRQLTIMCCNLVESAVLAETLDLEELREVVSAYQQTCDQVIQRFGGHTAQLVSNGLIVYFGWPQAHGDDAQRAVHTGLEMLNAMGTENARIERKHGLRLAIRIGIHTGLGVVGEMGGSGRHEPLALGETPKIASCLQERAAPGTVVISAKTARLVEGAFDLERLGSWDLQGITEPVVAWRVCRQHDAHDHEETTAGESMQVIGRDKEVGLILQNWEHAKEGSGKVVLLSGDPGIGKSALARTVRSHVVQEGYTQITFRCSPYHTHSAFHPVIVHLERFLGFQRSDSPDIQLSKLEQMLQTYSPSLKEKVLLFAELLSVPLSGPAQSLTPQRRQEWQQALMAWMLEEAERQAVLTIWEDLQWADPSTLELLEMHIDQTPTTPVLHIFTYRPEFTPPWEKLTREWITLLPLGRLGRSQVETIITRLVGAKALPPEVVDYIVAKTDGVPLYVEELTKALLESNILREEADCYVLNGNLSEVKIPSTLHDSLMARLDRLVTAKAVAQYAAVIGRHFSYALLHVVSQVDEPTLQRELGRLVDAELVYPHGLPPQATYLFKHALIRDIAYESLLRSTRQGYHQRVATVLEAQFPETAATQPELLAHHFTEADDLDQAVKYWLRAGQLAMRRSAYQEAIGHLTKGRQLLQKLPKTPERLRHKLELQLPLGDAFLMTRGHGAPEVKDAYTRADKLCQQVGGTQEEVVRTLFGLYRCYIVVPDLDKTRQYGEKLRQLAEHTKAPLHYTLAYYVLGFTEFCSGNILAAGEHLNKGVEYYSPADRQSPAFLMGQDPGVFCRVFGACVQWLRGNPDQAEESAKSALEQVSQFEHPFSEAFTLGLVAQLNQHVRNPQATQKNAEAAMSIAEKRLKQGGFPLWHAFGQIFRGWAIAVQGKWQDGVSALQQGLTGWTDTGVTFYRPYFLGLLVEALLEGRQANEGLVEVNKALELVNQTQERWWEAELYRLKGEVLLLHLNVPKAEGCFEQALAVTRQQQAKSLELRAAVSLSRLWQQQGRRTEARELLTPVYNWFTERFDAERLDTRDFQDAKVLLEELA